MKDMMLLSGNEAVARAAADAGATVGTGYPGTPSTETLEAFAREEGVYAEWCTNEKVALEVALGASAGGARTLCTMKHVGVNVAADPLFTAAYTGVGGGLVILAADDPGMHSSQNEQDSHWYAQAAHVLMLDPADSQEAHDLAREAFSLSERFDVPVMVRSTVRIAHTKTPVQVQDAAARPDARPYEKDASKWVMMPAFAKGRRVEQLSRVEEMRAWADSAEAPNRIIPGDARIGVACAGAAFQHVREALPDASILKLGVTCPLPAETVRSFADGVDELYVVEEASTYLADAVRAAGVQVSQPVNGLPKAGELSPNLIRHAFGRPVLEGSAPVEGLPARPPALCPGCPHRVVFKELSRQKAIICGDIGCYTLGALPPLSAMDTCVDMGASVSMAHGFELALGADDGRPVVGVIGDSTFAHSGLSSLISTVYNAGAGTICILDNRTTAMTGRQGNPFNGQQIQGRAGVELDLERVVSAIGVEHVRTVDPNDVEAVRVAVREAVREKDRLDVLIFKSPCVLLERKVQRPYYVASCTGCGVCLTLGCPAIGKYPDTGLSYIDPQMCIGCGQCEQYCRFNAIVR